MGEDLYSMKVRDVPHSSIVGRSVMIVADKIGVVAQLTILKCL